MSHDIVMEHHRWIETRPLDDDLHAVFVEIDITSLDALGEETSFNAADYVTAPEIVMNGGKENQQYSVDWIRSADELHVYSASDASSVVAGTPVGVLDLLIYGA